MLNTAEEKVMEGLKKAQDAAGDVEVAHGLADKALAQFVIDLGYAGVADAYLNVPKWYA